MKKGPKELELLMEQAMLDLRGAKQNIENIDKAINLNERLNNKEKGNSHRKNIINSRKLKTRQKSSLMSL